MSMDSAMGRKLMYVSSGGPSPVEKPAPSPQSDVMKHDVSKMPLTVSPIGRRMIQYSSSK